MQFHYLSTVGCFFFGIVTDEPYFHFVRADCCISLMVWLGLWFAYSSGPTKQ
jgi:hypothetical protein